MKANNLFNIINNCLDTHQKTLNQLHTEGLIITTIEDLTELILFFSQEEIKVKLKRLDDYQIEISLLD